MHRDRYETPRQTAAATTGHNARGAHLTQRLEGYASHRRGKGKTYRHLPLIEAETAGRSTLGRVLQKIYGGPPITLLAHLVEQSDLSPAELARMRALLESPPEKG